MIKEFRKYDSNKIKYVIIQLKSQLLENRFKLAQASLKNTGIFKETRKLIAQLFTILSERKEKLTNADWKLYSEIITQNKSIDGIDFLNKKEVKILEEGQEPKKIEAKQDIKTKVVEEQEIQNNSETINKQEKTLKSKKTETKKEESESTSNI